MPPATMLLRLLLCIGLIIVGPLSSAAQALRVSPDGRYLTEADGTPFLWIGDTAWELFHVLTREEAIQYLDNRAAKGFSVIQAVVLAENDGLRTPNAYGAVPFEDFDPTRPNEAYFEHVDAVVEAAAARGLVMGLLPTWGDKVPSANPGAGPVVFTPENAYIYGRYLGARYREQPVVWILGGDRNIDSDESLAIWRAMAAGLNAGDGGRHLITYHPRGGSTSAYFLHKETWLDLNMYQSGHANSMERVYTLAEPHLTLVPRKPFLDGEPAYEDIPIRFWDYMDFSKRTVDRVPAGVLDENGLIADRDHFAAGFISAHDVRTAAYWNLLSGTAGHTYGNNAIWQMLRGPENLAIPALTTWQGALDRPGADDLRHVRALFTSRPFHQLIPDQAAVYGRNGEGRMHIRVASSSDGSFLLAYLALGQPVTLWLHHLPGEQVVAWWFDPRTGEAQRIGRFPTDEHATFTPPTSGVGQDWVLVIDAQDANLGIPGQ